MSGPSDHENDLLSWIGVMQHLHGVKGLHLLNYWSGVTDWFSDQRVAPWLGLLVIPSLFLLAAKQDLTLWCKELPDAFSSEKRLFSANHHNRHLICRCLDLWCIDRLLIRSVGFWIGIRSLLLSLSLSLFQSISSLLSPLFESIVCYSGLTSRRQLDFVLSRRCNNGRVPTFFRVVPECCGNY